MNYQLRTTNQLGLSSLLLLFMVALGVFIIWETTQFVDHYSQSREESTKSQGQKESREPICLTGESSDCNDSNDVFILD